MTHIQVLFFCKLFHLTVGFSLSGMSIVLAVAEGEVFVNDAEIQKSALQVVINCVCAPDKRMSSIGKFSSRVAVNTIYVFTAELYPTGVRATVVGIGSIFAKVGAMASSYIADLVSIVGIKLKM